MNERSEAKRRTTLKAIGAGILGSAVLSGSASAQGGSENGNGLGAFLNDEAAIKDRPIWDSGIADKTGQSEVSVSVGTMTSVDIPESLWPGDDSPPEEGPFGFTPRVVKVSPGTDVTWTWETAHHSVTSFNESADGSDGHGQLFDDHGDAGHEMTHTFDEVGNYLYFCHPHGTPYSMPFGPLGEVPNHVGMRGAVKVADD